MRNRVNKFRPECEENIEKFTDDGLHEFSSFIDFLFGKSMKV